jgi:hypothetical protein
MFEDVIAPAGFLRLVTELVEELLADSPAGECGLRISFGGEYGRFT